MPRFHYKAADASGDTSEGIIEASDQAAVVERLRAADQLPIRVEELTPELDIAQTGLKKKLPTLLVQAPSQPPWLTAHSSISSHASA